MDGVQKFGEIKLGWLEKFAMNVSIHLENFSPIQFD